MDADAQESHYSCDEEVLQYSIWHIFQNLEAQLNVVEADDKLLSVAYFWSLH